MKKLIACAFIALAACSPSDNTTAKSEPAKTEPVAAAPPTPVATEAPAGAYKLDKMHASLLFRVNHIGFSNYTAQFTDFDAQLQIDPKNPSASSLTATVNAASLLLSSPPKGFLESLLGKDWLDVGKFSQITFKSTSVELTGTDTARVTGDFMLHGVTAPLTLDVKFNGGYAGHPMDPNARIGFSAHGSLKRSAFGIAYGIPAPGTTMGVSDNVDVIIEVEFSGPPLATANPQPAPK
ncbi:MAG: YceI family protein [Micropepsaceae bacterium]